MRTVFVAVIVIACSYMTSAFAQEPIVFVFSYHNMDSAKSACDLIFRFANDVEGAADCKSVTDTRQLGRQLENQLTDALAVTTANNKNHIGICISTISRAEKYSGGPCSPKKRGWGQRAL